MNVCASIELLAILSSAKTHEIDIVHKWWLGFTSISLALVNPPPPNRDLTWLNDPHVT